MDGLQRREGLELTASVAKANVLVAGWTADGQLHENPWICTQCDATNVIVAADHVVGVAYVSAKITTYTPSGDGC